MVHRTEFEDTRDPHEIKRGQVLRIQLEHYIPDVTGFVEGINNHVVQMKEITGKNESDVIEFHISKIVNVIEIMSSPLFCNLRRDVSGEREGVRYLTWEQNGQANDRRCQPKRNPKIKLRAPEDCKHKRAWHFWKHFPMKELEYCTNHQLQRFMASECH